MKLVNVIPEIRKKQKIVATITFEFLFLLLHKIVRIIIKNTIEAITKEFEIVTYLSAIAAPSPAY